MTSYNEPGEADPLLSDAKPFFSTNNPYDSQWEMATSGTCQILKIDQQVHGHGAVQDQKDHHLLGQFAATSICGNDLTSSCLYVAGLCAASAGAYAPLSLLLVALTLAFFKAVYSEVAALPLNGGVYNILLNCTSKRVASIGATLTVVSYVATAVVSASDAIAYLHRLIPEINIMVGTILVLAVFCLLNLIGISESSVVATVIFTFHLITLFTLMVVSIINFDSTTFKHNTSLPLPNNRTPVQAIYFGYASAMLGISGFETSANFIEEQRPGVYVKSLRNMLVLATILNPTLSFLGLGVVDMANIAQFKSTFLAQMALDAGGRWLSIWLEIDAFVVLSGAVLTGYVGSTGLIRRMALDRLFPQAFLSQNKWTKTNHVIIIGFFLITSSMYLIVDGKIEALAAVYTLAFLSVMFLWGVGVQIFRFKRSKLPSPHKVRWITAFSATVTVTVGFIGTVQMKPGDLPIFLGYFLVAMLLVFLMFVRTRLLKLAIVGLRRLAPLSGKYSSALDSWLTTKFNNIKGLRIIFFASDDQLSHLNKAVLYVRDNELCNSITFVHIYSSRLSPTSEDQLGTIGFQHYLPPSSLQAGTAKVDALSINAPQPPGPSYQTEATPLATRSTLLDTPHSLSTGSDSHDFSIPREYSEIDFSTFPKSPDAPDIAKNLGWIDATYPKMRLDYLGVENAVFGPELVDKLAAELDIPQNFMFIACPSDRFPHNVGELGGVRTITSY